MTDAAHALGLAQARPPTLGSGRLLCIDGPAASGKSTLAAEVAALAGAPVVHLDDLYAGWDGLTTVGAQLATLLRPLAGGQPGRYRRWDWYADEWAETVIVPASALLVLEGVGSGDPDFAPLVTALVWVEAPAAVRRERDLGRGVAGLGARWDRWAAAEQDVFARHRTRERADLVIGDGAAATPA